MGWGHGHSWRIDVPRSNQRQPSGHPRRVVMLKLVMKPIHRVLIVLMMIIKIRFEATVRGTDVQEVVRHGPSHGDVRAHLGMDLAAHRG